MGEEMRRESAILGAEELKVGGDGGLKFQMGIPSNDETLSKHRDIRPPSDIILWVCWGGGGV